MTYQQVYDKIATLIAEQLSIPITDIAAESTLESLGADSVDRFEFVIKIEEEFNIMINDEDADRITTVGQATQYVIDQLNK